VVTWFTSHLYNAAVTMMAKSEDNIINYYIQENNRLFNSIN